MASPGESQAAGEALSQARSAARDFYSRPRAELAAVANAESDWGGFWRRFAAYFIDSLILYVPLTLVMGVGIALAGQGDGALALFLSIFVLPLVIFALYHGLLTGGEMVATPGRMAAGIAVVDARSGRPLGYGRAMARAIASFISYLLVIPNLVVAFTKRKQSVADMMVGSTVVSYRPANGVVIAVICAFVGIFLVGILAAIAIPAYQDYVVRARTLEAQVDLRNFASRVEDEWRKTGRPPRTLDGLGYSPRSKHATFSISPDGVILAELLERRSKALVGLRPSYDKGSDTLSWECVAQGWTVKSLRPRDCEHVD